MSQPAYPSESTALLLVDPYNDFLSEGGKVWPRIKPIAEAVGLIANLKATEFINSDHPKIQSYVHAFHRGRPAAMPRTTGPDPAGEVEP